MPGPRLTPVPPQSGPQAQQPQLPLTPLVGLVQGAVRLGYRNMNGLTVATFAGFRQDLSALLIVAKLRHNAAVASANVGLRFNTDSTNLHYFSQSWFGQNAGPAYFNTADQTQLQQALLSAGTTNNDFAVSALLIPGYAQIDASHNTLQLGTHFQILQFNGGLWQPTAPSAITQIDTTSPGAAYLPGSGIWLLGLP